MADINEIITKAKKEFKDPEDTAILESWEKELIQIAVSRTFLAFPETKRLLEVAQKEDVRISEKLKEDENLSDLERKALFRERSAHRKYINFLSRDPDQEEKNLISVIKESIGEDYSENKGQSVE